MLVRMTGAGTPLGPSTCHFFSVMSPTAASSAERSVGSGSKTGGFVAAGRRDIKLLSGSKLGRLGQYASGYQLCRHAMGLGVKRVSEILQLFKELSFAAC
jgi:hypothetical protein